MVCGRGGRGEGDGKGGRREGEERSRGRRGKRTEVGSWEGLRHGGPVLVFASRLSSM